MFDHKYIENTFREQPIADNYKLDFDRILQDPFGQVHQKRKDVQISDFSNFAFYFMRETRLDINPVKSLKNFLDFNPNTAK